MVQEVNVTVFSKAHEPKNGRIISLESALNGIRTGGKSKETILAVAAEKDKKTRDKIKANLPVICFNGEFSYRNIDNFERHNGMMILDVDDIKDMDATRKQIESLPYVYACFLSPSYLGLKFIIRIPTIDVEKIGTLESDYIFKEYFEGICSVVENIDPSGKDTSRACFVSYDPNIYINKDATVFDKRVKVERPQNYRESISIPYSSGSADWALKIISDKVSAAADGHRHHELYLASRLAGGYVATGIIRESDAEAYLAEAFNRKPFDKDYKYRKTIADGIKNGLHYPIEDKNMNKPKEVEYAMHPQLVAGEQVETVSENKNYLAAAELMYVPFEDFQNEADELYANGNPRGLNGRYRVAKEFLSYKNGFTTYVYSSPYSGKTQWTISELVYLAETYGNKIAVYSTEIGEPKHVLAEVASTYIGKLYEHHDPNLRMNNVQKDAATRFFTKHFFVIDPIYKKNTIDVTVGAIFDAVKGIELKHNIHIDNVYIDPLSEIDDGGDERIERFTKKVNKMVNDDARINNRHNFLVSHVRDQAPIVDKNTGTSWFPVPTPREVSGGQNSFKQGHQMVCVYRPSPNRIDSETGQAFLKNETHVHIQKSKPKGVGKIGMFKLYYDYKTNRYYEDEDFTIYSDGKKEPQELFVYDIPLEQLPPPTPQTLDDAFAEREPLGFESKQEPLPFDLLPNPEDVF